MTVAAVVLFARSDGALADAAGRAAARRIVESAWAGGATPIVVVSFDTPARTVAAALAGSPAVLAEPAPVDAGPVGQIVHGVEVAMSKVAETEAALLWPGRMAWVDAETVTSLIEAHGARRDAVLRPIYDGTAGWPALLPTSLLPAFASGAATKMPDELLHDLADSGIEVATFETGDPGVVHDISTPLDSLPAYEGPPQPVGARAPEWGAAAAEMPDDGPLEGPALAPYPQAADPTD